MLDKARLKSVIKDPADPKKRLVLLRETISGPGQHDSAPSLACRLLRRPIQASAVARGRAGSASSMRLALRAVQIWMGCQTTSATA